MRLLPACLPAAQRKVCSGGRQYILHLRRNHNRSEALEYCQTKHGPWASLAEGDSAAEWLTMTDLVKQVHTKHGCLR